MAPGLLPNPKPTGTLTVSKELLSKLLDLNSVPSAKLMLLAVVARKEPPIFNWALLPKTIQLGLIRNKLAVPVVRRMPSILVTLLPVTLLNML